MNVALDQTIILGLQIFLDHRSLSSIGQKILIKLSHDETRFKKNKMRFMSEIKITEKNTFRFYMTNLTLMVVMLMTEICVQHIWLNLVKQWTMRIMGSTYDPGRLQPLSHQIIVSLSFIIKMLCSRRSIVMFVIMLVLKETSFGIFKMSSFFIQDRQ